MFFCIFANAKIAINSTHQLLGLPKLGGVEFISTLIIVDYQVADKF